VIGVVLTGMLDDGTAGLMAIKRCGGVTVVQDPRDAAYSGMPVNALNNVDVDFCVAVAEMGPLLTTLVSQPHGKSKAVSSDIRTEAVIAERVLSDVSQVNGSETRCRITAPGVEASCGKWTPPVKNGTAATRAIRTRVPRSWRVSLKSRRS
jgi:two-component system chemotaxis response regulator CheB